MIDDLRTDYEGKPMEITADLVFRSRVRDIQAVICTQTGPWKIFIVILFHPLDITLVIRKYAGGSVQGNILSMVRIKLGFIRLGGSSAVPNTEKPKVEPDFSPGLRGRARVRRRPEDGPC